MKLGAVLLIPEYYVEVDRLQEKMGYGPEKRQKYCTAFIKTII